MRSVKVESASNTGKQSANLYKGDIIDGSHGQGGQSYGRKHVEFGILRTWKKPFHKLKRKSKTQTNLERFSFRHNSSLLVSWFTRVLYFVP
jgi:hypothetical protein